MSRRAPHLTCALLALLGGCGTAAPPASEPVPSVLDDPCLAGRNAPAPLAAETLAVPGEAARSNTERVPPIEATILRHRYDGLVRLDCRGIAQGVLALTWRREGNGRRWRFTLSPDARFSDGGRVDALSVATAWGVRPAPARIPPTSNHPPAAVDSLVVHGDDEFSLFLNRPLFDVAAFAALEWLVIGRRGEGTGPYELGGTTSDETRLVTRDPRRRAELVVRRLRDNDARNAIDAHTHAIITDDPSAIRYAEVSGGYESHRLPWDREYLLAVPQRPRSAPQPTSYRLSGLVAAVAVDARTATPNHWSADGARCAARIPPGGVVPRRGGVSVGRELVYDAGDRTARRLAERLFALDVPAGGNLLLLNGLPTSAYHEALRRGDADAFIVAVDGRGRSPCQRWQELVERARWTGLPGAATLTPLIETRRHLLLRTGYAALINGDGTIIVPPGGDLTRQ